jgi:hypothetical protein
VREGQGGAGEHVREQVPPVCGNRRLSGPDSRRYA